MMSWSTIYGPLANLPSWQTVRILLTSSARYMLDGGWFVVYPEEIRHAVDHLTDAFVTS